MIEFRLDKEGYTLVTALFGATCGAIAGYLYTGLVAFFIPGALTFASMLFSAYFFRDPERQGPSDPDVAISAADGVVVDVSEVATEGFDTPMLRIAVFMNVFNVHVNRCPVPGTVIATKHRNGKKLSAYNKRAEYENEHGDTDVETRWGTIRIRQIAGLVARRVVTRAKKGIRLSRGERIGLIRFGSRVDVFLPPQAAPLVTVGDHVRAGETAIAQLYRSGCDDTKAVSGTESA